MHRNVARLRVIVGIVLTISLLGGAAALATHNIDHAERQISAIVEQADDDMAAVVARFAIDAPTAWTGDELDSMEDAAKGELDDIKDAASKALDDIKKVYDDLDTAVKDAKSAVSDARSVFKDQLKAITDSTVPPGNTTTTTTPPNPTTTAPPGNTTTTEPAAATTAAPPGSPATTGPPSPTATAPPATTVVTSNSPPAGSSSSGISRGTLDDALAAPPGFTSGDESPATRPGGLSGTLTNGLSVVLPPTVATAVLSPLIVLEVLFATLVSSVRALVLPTLLMLIAWFVVMPRRRSRSAEDLSTTTQPRAT